MADFQPGVVGPTPDEERDVVVATVLAEPGTMMLTWNEETKSVDSMVIVVWVTLSMGDTLPGAYTQIGCVETGIDHFGIHFANGSAVFNESMTDEMNVEYRKLSLWGEDRYRADKRRNRG